MPSSESHGNKILILHHKTAELCQEPLVTPPPPDHTSIHTQVTHCQTADFHLIILTNMQRLKRLSAFLIYILSLSSSSHQKHLSGERVASDHATNGEKAAQANCCC